MGKTAYETVRVFISSTFRDMQAERDYLVRFVFPKLREELLARRIHLVDVDLRWGVTGDQDALELCREIVDECRPRFLCILGGRYGWVPPGRTRSITADEVHYGVLDCDLAQRGFAFFYFRDPAATAAMRETYEGEFREPEGSASQKSLQDLKSAIVNAGLQPFIYPAQWNNDTRRLIGLKALGDRVRVDLLASMANDPKLKDRFGEHITLTLDEFAEENATMEAFVAERVERFVLGSRKLVLDELLAHAEGTGGNGYLCLVGEPGAGKSALLAYLFQHLTLNTQSSTLVISHFVGASIGSTDVRRTLRRLCHELGAGVGINPEIPEEPEKLRAAFLGIFKQACTQKRIVVLIDALNQFDPTPPFADLSWLPEELPDNASVILSTSSGPALEDLYRRRRPPREVMLSPLMPTDGEAIIKEFLHRYRKAMTDAQRSALLAKKDAGIPLYLLVALEELRTLGTYEEITDRIAQLPPETQALFVWIFNRLAEDDGFRDASGRRIGQELVPKFASLMGVSRHGLSQRELVELLAPGAPRAEPALPDDEGNVAGLIRLLRPYLMRRGELLDFYHGQFRTAVGLAYLQTDVKRHAAHEALADYFEAKPLSGRKVDELPWQLERAGLWLRLSDTLRDLPFNTAARQANRFEVTGYWGQVERHSHRRLVDAFRGLANVSIQEENAGHIWNVALLLANSGHADEALEIWRALIDYGRRSGDHRRLSGALGNAAIRMKDLGELDTAMEFHKEEEWICRTYGDNYGLQNSLGNQGLITARQGKLDEAMALHKEKERICREIGHRLGIAASLGNQALIMRKQDPGAALTLYQEEMQICRSIDDREGIARSLRNQALVYEGMGKLERALALLRDSERMCRELGSKVELARCLMDQARVVQEQGGAKAEPEALRQYGQAEEIYRNIGDRESLARCLHGMSHVHISLNQPDEALACLDEAQDIFRERGNHNGFEACLLNRARVIHGWDDQIGLELLLEQEVRLRESRNHEYLIQCLLTQVPILMKQGKLVEAMEKSIESETLGRKIGDTRRLALSLDYQTKIRECEAAGEAD